MPDADDLALVLLATTVPVSRTCKGLDKVANRDYSSRLTDVCSLAKGLPKFLAKVVIPTTVPIYVRHLQKAWLTGLAKVPITTTVLALACNDTAWHQTMPRDVSALP